jgi:hypothetical protein
VRLVYANVTIHVDDIARLFQDHPILHSPNPAFLALPHGDYPPILELPCGP